MPPAGLVMPVGNVSVRTRGAVGGWLLSSQRNKGRGLRRRVARPARERTNRATNTPKTPAPDPPKTQHSPHPCTSPWADAKSRAEPASGRPPRRRPGAAGDTTPCARSHGQRAKGEMEPGARSSAPHYQRALLMRVGRPEEGRTRGVHARARRRPARAQRGKVGDSGGG